MGVKRVVCNDQRYSINGCIYQVSRITNDFSESTYINYGFYYGCKTHNLSRNKFTRALASQPISAPHFFNPQQMFLLRVKLITQCEKRETSTKTCNETMLGDKLPGFLYLVFRRLYHDRILQRVYFLVTTACKADLPSMKCYLFFSFKFSSTPPPCILAEF